MNDYDYIKIPKENIKSFEINHEFAERQEF